MACMTCDLPHMFSLSINERENRRQHLTEDTDRQDENTKQKTKTTSDTDPIKRRGGGEALMKGK